MVSITTSPPLIVILGTTASGKTDVGIELARIIGGEIICADSRTIYKGMNIGTAKPMLKEQQGVPHHLLDIIEPDQKYSAAQFKSDAERLIGDIIARCKYPIIVGGTGLYVDSVLYDYQFSLGDTEPNPENKRHLNGANQDDRKKQVRDNTLIIGMTADKEVLRERITKRVEQMFEDGFLQEVEWLSDKYGWENESMSGIGYRLARDYFEGRASIDEVKEAFVHRDLSLAKRQMTWFKRNKSIQWFDHGNKAQIIQTGRDFADQFKL